ncbi:MAG TPA: hypothetical protein VNF04_07605 [Stellaceae bacterium]|nr:hypothetical protein [Stellaceae bacterium]
MPIHHSVWRVADPPSRLLETTLASEQMLEQMIVAAPEIVSDQWMIIGRQEPTAFGGQIDLFAIAPDGSLVLIELKRDRTPRQVVAQALDYATWVEALDAQEVGRIYARFAPEHNLASDFQTRFGQPLDEETLNQNHQIVIVAASLDASSERIVSYLNQRDIPINVLCFQVFDTGSEQLLSRAWLLDPTETQITATATGPATAKEPWNGEYYVNYDNSWEEAVKYGFVCAGGGSWYSDTLKLLKPDDRIWVKAPGHGFVGVGRVKGPAAPVSEFKVIADGREQSVLNVANTGKYRGPEVPEKMEYFVPVEWLQTVTLDKAINEIGLFGNQNTVCRPRTPKWRHTIDRLKEAFPHYDE